MSLPLERIRGFAFDVDGVFTDGSLLCDTAGELYRTFDSKDGFGVRMARLHGYPVAIITGGRSVSIRERFLTSGVAPEDIYLHSRDKAEEMDAFCAGHGFSMDEVLFMGDDIPDLDLIRRCGLNTLADMAEELGYPIKEKYALSCELCHDMLGNEELAQKLEPLVIKKVEEQRIAKLFADL